MTPLDFRQRRVARVLLITAILAPMSGPLAFVLLPLVSVVGLVRAKRWPLLAALGGAIVASGVLAFVTASLGFGAARSVEILGVAAGATFMGICLSAPSWLALVLWSRNGPTWRPVLYAVALVLCGAGLPLLSLGLFGVSTGALGLFLGVIVMAIAAWPLLRVLPPIPELLPLAEALKLLPDNQGWSGPGLYLSRRGQLHIQLPFSAEIPGLFATKRGPKATLPLLGDAVLDNTLELRLPQDLRGLAEAPTLLLEAVHGAQATVEPGGVTMNRALDTAAFKADPKGSLDRVLAEVQAIRALHAALDP